MFRNMNSYRIELFISFALRIILWFGLAMIVYVMVGCSNRIVTDGTANSNIVRQNAQLCVGLKADSESCTPLLGGNDEKSDRAPLQPAK
jgi:hypothetical protein